LSRVPCMSLYVCFIHTLSYYFIHFFFFQLSCYLLNLHSFPTRRSSDLDQMTLNEMRDELNMSKPSMSTGIRKLQKYGMVKRKYEKGSREHTYIAEKNFFRSFMSFYWQMWEREATMNL